MENKSASQILPFDGCSDEVKNPPAPAPPLYTPEPIAQFGERNPPKWIIKKLFQRVELAVIFGESGSGKTFLALQLAMCIARGEPWNKLKAVQGRVVYLCAEGAGGFRNRIHAYAKRHNIDLATLTNFHVIPASPNFLVDKDVNLLINALRLHGATDVIFIDTFARVTSGSDENNGKDMGAAIAFCQAIHRLTGALVVLIHHAGKDASKGARGWSGIKAALDTEIEVTKTENSHKAKLTKQKDGEDGMEWGFDLIQVEIGKDEDNEAITSCYYEDADPPAKPAFERKLGGWQGAVMSAFEKTTADESNSFILADVLIELTVQNSAPNEKGARDTRRQHIRRAITTLCTNNVLRMDGEKVLKV